jgi:hypothetical protein
VESSVPKGTIDWRGFRSTQELQQEMGHCRALINTPKWNEAYGNVVVEALACGVPVALAGWCRPTMLLPSRRRFGASTALSAPFAAAGLKSTPPVRSSVSVLKRGFEQD